MIDFNRKRQDYRQTFGGEHGKRVLLDMMRRHFVLQSTKVPGDAGESAFREGRRSVVLDIMNVLRMDEQQVLDLPQETDSYD